MTKSRPFKDKPWLILEETSFLETLFFGSRSRMYVDTKHPEWIKRMLKTNENLKKINKQNENRTNRNRVSRKNDTSKRS